MTTSPLDPCPCEKCSPPRVFGLREILKQAVWLGFGLAALIFFACGLQR